LFMSSQPYPIDLVLIRHGQSEGNLAQARSDQGSDEYWNVPEFKERHTSRYRLTSAGIAQAKQAGEWVRKNIANSFDRYYCSEYVRALETAAHLGFQNAEWFSEFFLREQDMGILAGKSKMERNTQFKSEMERRARDLFYYQPPGGESIATCALRVENFLSTLKASCSGFRVIVVCHGNIMKAIRIRIERMSQQDFMKFQTDPLYKTYNCQIIWYSRRDPGTCRIARDFNWVKSICPWDTTKTPTDWVRIKRPVYSNEALLQMAESVPRLVDNQPGEEVDSND